MRRREFIGLIGGAAMWPLSARGQQPAVRVIGVLALESLAGARASFAPAQRRLAALVGDLVERRVSVIVAPAGPSIIAAKAATTSIPIIFFTGFDPVASGFVASLNRPGGNVTGISALNTEVLAKRLELLRELVPTAKSIAWLYSQSSFAIQKDLLKDMKSAADALGIELLPVEASHSG